MERLTLNEYFKKLGLNNQRMERAKHHVMYEKTILRIVSYLKAKLKAVSCFNIDELDGVEESELINELIARYPNNPNMKRDEEKIKALKQSKLVISYKYFENKEKIKFLERMRCVIISKNKNKNDAFVILTKLKVLVIIMIKRRLG